MGMGRFRFVTLVFGCVLVAGCMTDDSDIEPKVTTRFEVETSGESGRSCPITTARVHVIGTTATVNLQSANITKSCRCQETSTPQWSCSGERCTTAYDLGHENPQLCERLAYEPVPMPKTKVTAYPETCTAVVIERGVSESTVLVSCPTPTDAHVWFKVEGMGPWSRRFVFTADGQCPTSQAPDAQAADDDETDAGPAETDAGPAETDAGYADADAAMDAMQE